MQEQRLDPLDQDLETTLRGLQPAQPAIDRDVLMFEAGQRSQRRRAWLWQGTSGVLAAALLMSVMLWPRDRVVERLVYVDRPIEAVPRPIEAVPRPVEAPREAPVVRISPSLSSTEPTYLAWRQDVLEQGLDALPRQETAFLHAGPVLRVRAIPEVKPQAEKNLPLKWALPFFIGGES